MLEEFEGWLFDAYPESGGMRLWLLRPDGRHVHCLDPWQPVFHLAADAERQAAPFIQQLPRRWVEKRELFSGESLRVLEVRVPVLERDPLVRRLKRLALVLYDADVHLVQTYHYDRGHFPLARCLFRIDEGRLVAWELRDDPWAVDYELPPLKIMHLALSGSEVAGKIDPNHVLRGKLVLTVDGRAHELEGSTEEQLESLSRRLCEWDPDVITTEWGDSVLLPRLDLLGHDHGVKIPFSRDLERNMAGRGERSFHTYGRTIYQHGARTLFGRWHLDLNNSFLLGESGMEGLFEIARIARIPVQRAGRCTIGTSLSSMQTCWAWQQGILIPMDKQQAEDFRPATDLLVADKGGLVFEPEVGWHEQVAEYDFTSMYPEMMVQHNISPETVNCGCCPDNLVPEIGHHLCRKRRGLVPSVLAPILAKRARYKALAKQGGAQAAIYKKRAIAHKWCLVCCFGYLGFKNARFGKIESHECVTAWGREVLLRAKESVESRGYHLLHAFVDAVWIKVGPETDLEGLRLAIEKEASCPMALEGVYKWIRYAPSKRDKLSGVPNRYFGAFQNGELKIRGIACRRHDTPKLIKEMQGRLLDCLAQADGLSGCGERGAVLLDIVEDYRLRLREGRVSAEDLAITFNLSKAPEEYVAQSVQTLAARQLAAAGIKLHAGETVRYVITAANDSVKEWRTKPLALIDGPLEYDVGKYLELIERAAGEVLEGIVKLPTAARKGVSRELELPLGWK